MQAHKNYNIQIKGKVQDMGFRNLVESIAKSLNVRGMVYNDSDGTVKIVCRGATPLVTSLVKELEDKCVNVGAAIDEVNQEEIPCNVYLPPVFFKAPTDELSDIGRKLDVGIESIRGIERNTGALLGGQDKMIQSLDSLTDGQDKMIQSLDSLTDGQDSLVKGQNRAVELLEKIANKL